MNKVARLRTRKPVMYPALTDNVEASLHISIERVDGGYDIIQGKARRFVPDANVVEALLLHEEAARHGLCKDSFYIASVQPEFKTELAAEFKPVAKKKPKKK